MNYMYSEKLKSAYKKSDELSELLHYDDDRMISTQEILNIIKERYCKKIELSFARFSECGINKPYGAMMRTVLDGENKVLSADIVLNTDNDASFQRFSLLHELGHLVTEAWQDVDIYKENENRYVVSTHIDYRVTSISEDEYENSKYLTNEQIANIFALRVLMPSSHFYKKMEETNDIKKTAKFFGVAPDAVISRMMIGA